MNLNELRNQAYRNAVVHGWHEENMSDEHFLCLVISELMEAVEADRKESHAVQNRLHQCLQRNGRHPAQRAGKQVCSLGTEK